MINNLAISIPDRWKYADDLATAELCYKNIQSSAATIMADLSDEAAANRMAVNVQKSFVLTFSFLKSNPECYPPLSPSSRVTELKLLGVYLTADLKSEKQTEMLHRRANAGISSLKLLSRHRIPSDHLLRAYTSFIRSCLEYCSPVWHCGQTQEQSDAIKRVQFRALLVISKAPLRSW